MNRAVDATKISTKIIHRLRSQRWGDGKGDKTRTQKTDEIKSGVAL